MQKLENLYENGSGVPRDYQEAFRLYLDSAQRVWPPAQASVGAFYDLGLETKANPFQAFIWSKLAADNNNPDALERMKALAPKISKQQRLQAETFIQNYRQQQQN